MKNRRGDGAIWQIFIAGGARPRWRSDGLELFYLSEQGYVTAVPVGRLTERPGTPIPLFDARLVLPLVFSEVVYDVWPDRSRFLVAAGQLARTKRITVALDWLGGARL